MRWKPFSSEYKKKGFESLNVLLETLKVTRKSLNMMSAWKPFLISRVFVFSPHLLPSAGESIQEKAAAAAAHRRLIRNRRNISWYKQHSDFWAWYKYFTDNGNQEAVSERFVFDINGVMK